MLSEISQKKKLCVESRIVKLIEAETEWGLPRAGGGEHGEVLVKGYQVSVMPSKFWRSIAKRKKKKKKKGHQGCRACLSFLQGSRYEHWFWIYG